MKTFEIEGIDYKLPEDLNEMTLESTLELIEMLQIGTDSDLLTAMNIFSIMTGCSMDTLMKLNTMSFNKIIENLKWFETLDLSKFSNRVVMIEGKAWELIDLNKLTMGESVSIDLVNRRHQTLKESYPRILSVILRPEGEQFNADLMEERAQYFRQFGTGELVVYVNFFLNGVAQSISDTQNSGKL
jgi:hypothetical protein